RGRTRRRTTGARRKSRSDAGEIQRVQSVMAFVPVITSERAARETKLHNVKKLAVAGVELHFTVVKQIVRAADAWSDFVGPTEIDVRESFGVERRIVFVVEADARIDREAASSDSPGILQVEGLIRSVRETGV